MGTEEEIAAGLRALFQEINPTSFTSLNDVVLRLQSKLGFDLTNHIDFIRAHITLLFSGGPPQQQQQPHHHGVVVPTTAQHHPSPLQNTSYQQQHVYYQQHSHFGAGFGVGVGGGHVGPTQISFGGGGGGGGGGGDIEPVVPKESAQTRPKRRGGPGGLNKLCGVTPLLQTIVGQPAMPRTEIVKQLWAYIRKHNLQDPSNKRKIICNDELRLVFETDSTDMFQMNKLLAKHIVPLDTTKDLGQQSKKLKVEDSQVSSTEPSRAPTPTGSDAPAPTAPVPSAPAHAPEPAPAAAPVPSPIVISEALANFFGISEKEMPQSEVFKRMEEYIKVEGLEDPLNSMIICDTKLQDLLGCESISTPGIHEALARNHLFQRA